MATFPSITVVFLHTYNMQGSIHQLLTSCCKNTYFIYLLTCYVISKATVIIFELATLNKIIPDDDPTMKATFCYRVTTLYPHLPIRLQHCYPLTLTSDKWPF